MIGKGKKKGSKAAMAASKRAASGKLANKKVPLGKEKTRAAVAPTAAPVVAAAAKPVKPAAAKRPGRSKTCSEDGCQLPQISDHYCRLHYIKNWSSIISSRRAQARVNLNKYIENLSEKYPDEYMEKIRDDLGNEGTFHARLRELGFREEYETSSADNPFQVESVDDFVHNLKYEE